MDNEQLPNTNEISSTSNPTQYASRFEVTVKILKWFFPPSIVVAFLVGLGSAGFCLLFCSPTTIENIFIWLGIGSVVAALIYVPIVSAKKISQATTKKSLVLETLGLIVIGYAIIFGITLGWLGISSHQPEGWKPSLNERMLGWIQVTVGEIQDSKRDAINQAKFNNDSFEFVPASSELTLINSHDAVLSTTGTISGLDKLNGLEGNSQYIVVISEVAVGDMAAQGDVVKRLKGEHGVLGEELWTSTLNLGAGDSQQITISAALPKEFAQVIKDKPDTTFKVKLELLAESAYTYQKFNFTSIWSQETSIVPKYAGQFLKDRQHEINFRLPDAAVKFTKIDEKGNFVTESDNQVNFTVTTNPKMSLCCEAPELKVTSTWGNSQSLEDYLETISWKGEIVSKKVGKSGTVAIVEANPTIASPYKAIIYKRFDEFRVYQLTEKNSGLDELYNLYLESYKKFDTF